MERCFNKVIMRRILLVVLAAIITACAADPYVIIQVADAQLGFTAADISQKEGTEYVNDLTYESECLKKAVAMINEIRPDAVVFTGDQVNRSGDEEQWNTFTEIISSIDASVKVFHIPGNHDVIIGDGKVDTAPFAVRFLEDRFVHVENGVRLVGINSNLVRYDDPSEEDQKMWLDEMLEKSSSDEVTLVFSHHPFFLTSIEEDDGYFQIQKDKRHAYFEIFKKHGVNAVFAGHLHDSRAAEYQGIPMLTTTSAAYQLGKSKPSVRKIVVMGRELSEELLYLHDSNQLM